LKKAAAHHLLPFSHAEAQRAIVQIKTEIDSDVDADSDPDPDFDFDNITINY